MQPHHGTDLSNVTITNFPALNLALGSAAETTTDQSRQIQQATSNAGPGVSKGNVSQPENMHVSSGIAAGHTESAATTFPTGSGPSWRNARPSSAPATVQRSQQYQGSAQNGVYQAMGHQRPCGPTSWGVQRPTGHTSAPAQVQPQYSAQQGVCMQAPAHSTHGAPAQMRPQQESMRPKSAQCMPTNNWQQPTAAQRGSSSAPCAGRQPTQFNGSPAAQWQMPQPQPSSSGGQPRPVAHNQVQHAGTQHAAAQPSSIRSQRPATSWHNAQVQQFSQQAQRPQVQKFFGAAVAAQIPTQTVPPTHKQAAYQPAPRQQTNNSCTSQSYRPNQQQHPQHITAQQHPVNVASTIYPMSHPRPSGASAGNAQASSGAQRPGAAGASHHPLSQGSQLHASRMQSTAPNQQAHTSTSTPMPRPQISSSHMPANSFQPQHSAAVRPRACFITGSNVPPMQQQQHAQQQQSEPSHAQQQPYQQQQLSQQQQCAPQQQFSQPRSNVPAMQQQQAQPAYAQQQQYQQQQFSQQQKFAHQQSSRPGQQQAHAQRPQQPSQMQQPHTHGTGQSNPPGQPVQWRAPMSQQSTPHAPSSQSPAQAIHAQTASAAQFPGATHRPQQPCAPTNEQSSQNASMPCVQGVHPQNNSGPAASYRPLRQQQGVSAPANSMRPAAGSMNMHVQNFTPRSGVSTLQQHPLPNAIGSAGNPQSQAATFPNAQRPLVQHQQTAAFMHANHAQPGHAHARNMQHQQPQYQQQQQQQTSVPIHAHCGQTQQQQYQQQQQQQQSSVPMHANREQTLAQHVQQQQQALTSMHASHMQHPSGAPQTNGCQVAANAGSMGLVAGQGMAGTFANGPRNMTAGQAQGAVCNGFGGDSDFAQTPPWVQQQQAAAATAHMPTMVACIKPGPQGKMFLHLPNPKPKLAKHLVANYPFLKPVGNSISPTNFQLEAEHLSTILKIDSCNAAGVNLKLEEMVNLPRRLLLAGGSLDDETARFSKLPEKLQKTLHPFQVDGVKFALKNGGRVLLADEMGLGKTIQALAVVQAFRHEWPVLIVAPVSLKDNWACEAHRWLGVLENDAVVVSNPSDLERARLQSIPMVIANYELLSKSEYGPGKLGGGQQLNFNVIICDESHRIKNHKAQCTKNIVPLLARAKRAVLISGTPAMSKPAELMPQLRALLPSCKFSNTEFAERYCVGDKFDNLKGARNLEELNMVLVNTVMIRRLKCEVLKDLPPKLRNTVMLKAKNGEDLERLQELNKETQGISRVLNACMGRAYKGNAQAEELFASVGKETQQQVMRAFTACAELKINLVIDHVSSKLDSEIEKFLVFAHHKNLLDAVERACNQKGAEYIRIDGQLATHKRQQLVNKFQDDASCRVAILSIKAAGVGLTLTAASHVIFAELYWIPGDLEQAEDRVHRIGQACTVVCDYLLLADSIEERIWEMLKRKLQDTGTMLNGKKGSLVVSSSFTGGGNDSNNSAAVRSAVNAAAYSKRKATDAPPEPVNKAARQNGASTGQVFGGPSGGSSSMPAAQQNVAPNAHVGNATVSSQSGKVGEQRRISDLFTKQTPK